MTKDIQKGIDWAVGIAKDDSHGYDQTHRNGPDYDCSSFISTALWVAGFAISPNSWTGNMKEQLLAAGFKICLPPWKAGDIHLNEKHHVCMSINEKEIVEANINENCRITGGKTGDQTGHEIHIRDYYDYKHGWDIHLRPECYSNVDRIVALQVAAMVIQGMYGNGNEREEKLKKAGYNAKVIQDIVNFIYREMP